MSFRIDTDRLKVREMRLQAEWAGTSRLDLTGSGELRCLRPPEAWLAGHPDKLLVHHGIEPDAKTGIFLDVRCRKCEACLRHRGRLWTARAITETTMSTRTWFGTLTLSPDRQTWARYAALSRLSARGVASPTTDEIFAYSVAVIGEEITKFLKRVRKTAPLRYLLVTEAHRSGLPHFHALIHEYQGNVTKRVLDKQWNYGFSQWRLLDNDNPQACGYACKYLAKSALTRVRASARYGQGHIGLLTERVIGATLAASSAKARKGGGNEDGQDQSRL